MYVLILLSGAVMVLFRLAVWVFVCVGYLLDGACHVYVANGACLLLFITSRTIHDSLPVLVGIEPTSASLQFISAAGETREKKGDTFKVI